MSNREHWAMWNRLLNALRKAKGEPIRRAAENPYYGPRVTHVDGVEPRTKGRRSSVNYAAVDRMIAKGIDTNTIAGTVGCGVRSVRSRKKKNGLSKAGEVV